MPPLESLETCSSTLTVIVDSPTLTPTTSSKTLSDGTSLFAGRKTLEQQQPTTTTTTTNPSSSSSSRIKQKRRKKVGFFPQVHIYRVPNLESYTTEEIDNIWYTELEYEQIRYHRQRTIDKMRWGEEIPMDDLEYSDVGLYTWSETARRESFILYAQRAVMEEQEYQWETYLSPSSNHNNNTTWRGLPEGIVVVGGRSSATTVDGTTADATAARAKAVEIAAEAIAEAYYEATCDMQWEAYERGVWLAEDLALLEILDQRKINASTPDKKKKKTTGLFQSPFHASSRSSLSSSSYSSNQSSSTLTVAAVTAAARRQFHSPPLQRISLTRALSLRSAEGMLNEMMQVIGCA